MRTKTLKSTGTFQSQHTKLLQQTDQISYTSTNQTKHVHYLILAFLEIQELTKNTVIYEQGH